MRLQSAFLVTAAALSAAEYRRPIVFGHGVETVHSKIWIMEDDGSNQRQLTDGPSYDDHPSLYSDLRHVLYSEFAAADFKPEKGAKLIKLDIYTGAREVVAEVPGCALHHASLSPIGDRLAYHRDCGINHEQWVDWGPEAYRVNTAASNGVALPDSIIFMHEVSRGGKVRAVSLARMWDTEQEQECSSSPATSTCIADRPFLPMANGWPGNPI